MENEIKKTFFEHVLGPRGGLFAMGIFVGMFTTHIYMTEFVMDAQISAMQDQITGLQTRVVTLESDKAALNKKLQDIAFENLAADQ